MPVGEGLGVSLEGERKLDRNKSLVGSEDGFPSIQREVTGFLEHQCPRAWTLSC